MKPNDFCAGVSYGHSACLNKPTATAPDGKKWCWRHDPERVRLDNEKKGARGLARRAAGEDRADARFARDELLRAADAADLTDAELRQLAAAGGLRALLSQTTTDPITHET
jgi:hypothetical protein